MLHARGFQAALAIATLACIITLAGVWNLLGLEGSDPWGVATREPPSA